MDDDGRGEDDAGDDPEGVTIPVIPKTDFDFGFLGGADTYQRVVVNRLQTVGFNQSLLAVRLHAKQASSGSSVRVLLQQSAPTDEDDANFVVSSPSEFLGVSVTSGTPVPSLIRSVVAFEPAQCLRVSVLGQGGSTSVAIYTISADLLLRSAPRPCVEVSQHNYNTTSTLLRFVPINGQSESASIGIEHQWLAPGDGELVEIVIMNSTAGGSTTIGFHRNGSVTPEESQVVNISTVLSSYVVPFERARFSKGDRIHISVTPGASPGNVWLTCRFHYSKV